MSTKFGERFENHMDGIDAGTKGDAKKINDFDDDPYDDGFEAKLADTSDSWAEDNSVNKPEAEGEEQRKETRAASKRTLADKPIVTTHGYTMNTPKTIEHMKERMDDEVKKYFDKMLQAGGGIEGQHAHLRGTGREYFMTSSAEHRASGNFLTEESPGDTPNERKENLQLPPENDASVVYEVISEKPAIVLTSEVSPQKQFAEESGYEARDGMKQVFTPNLNENGAIDAGIYKIEHPKVDDDDKEKHQRQ